MNIGKEDKILSFESPKAFDKWLARYHNTSKVLWIQIYKKASGRTSITYDQALEVALCYGWIDGIVKKYDADSYIQRFTPRRPKGNWSKRNTEIVDRLIEEGKMRKGGMIEVEAAKKDGRWDAAYASSQNAVIPHDFIEKINQHAKARMFFESLNKTNKYYIAYQLETAKKPETLQRRKEKILTMLKEGKKFY